MTRILFVDPIGGAAGDMLLSALIDAGAPEEAVREAVDAVLPGRFALATEEVHRAGLRARRLLAEAVPGAEGSGHGVRRVSELLTAVERAPEPIRARVRTVLERLAEAEARIHGTEPDQVELHALGDDDTLLDVVGISAALEWLGIERIEVAALPLGAGGSVPATHGHMEIPLPAPATVELLHGFRLRGGGTGETVTPTAAAVFAALAEPAEAIPEMTLDAVGYGAGTRDDPRHPNVVRVLVGTPAAGSDGGRTLTVLEANVDDLTPELISDAAAALFAAGALDVWTTPVQMKKGRPGVVVSAICENAVEPAVRRTFFEATSTFGVRSHSVTRSELERRMVAVQLTGGTVRVKMGLVDGRAVTATPEHDDVAELAHQLGKPVREVYEEAAAAARQLREREAQRR
jgi:uncharacterized protein (TIGR00299 family) protein